ncbi:hypothetical protein [Dokdonia sp.]|uniref:hypothetical protein n=1 Tax=Dokdonia sp. TaxID=2024995 RepID=UPI003266FB1C
MNKKIILFMILLSSISSIAQIKIGNNPNSIDNNSLLELESTSKVLVITRVTNTQMNVITPLAGAMVYNTDENCVFQYNGINWTSLCNIDNAPTLVDNQDGTYTFTNILGETIIIDTNATSSPYNNANSGLNATNVQDAIDEIIANDLDTDPTNELQTFSIDGTELTLSNGGGTIILPTSEGPQGDVGPQGPAGNDGANGADGADGINGTDGADGAQGPQGDVGPQGPAGNDGANGADGVDGINGIDGAQGPQGDVGPQGPAGNDGANGADGADGINGTDGADGAQGPQGDVGPQGPAGNDGANGADGIDGINGTDGAQGPQGDVGPQGPRGIPGNDGTNGIDGAQGQPGQDGQDGATGPQGQPGQNGQDGATGPQGQPGQDGQDGATGPTGATGPQGAQGPIGPQGVPGAQGPQGQTGATGPAGTDGADGAIGPQGEVGPSNAYTGFFIIDNTTLTDTGTYEQVIDMLPFEPSQVTFVAHPNITGFDINDDNGTSGDNTALLENTFGTMNGFARAGTPLSQAVIFSGGSGSSINDISRYSNDDQCIGLRYTNNNGDNMGVIAAKLTSFETDGFKLDVTYTEGTSGNANRQDDILDESIVVMFTAYK